MPKVIDIGLIGTDISTLLPQRDLNDLTVEGVQAGQIFGKVKLKFTIIQNQKNSSNAIVYTVSPVAGESEQTFISCRASEYRNIKNGRLGADNKTRVPIMVVLTNADLLAPAVVARLQLHLKQMLIDKNDEVFTIGATSSLKAIDAIFLKAAQQAYKMKQYTSTTIPSTLQKVLGAMAGFFLNPLVFIVRNNPIYNLLQGIRSDYQKSSNSFIFLFEALLTFLSASLMTLAYCLLPLTPLVGAYQGWKFGAAEIIEQSFINIKERDVLTGAIILALMVAAALCVVFPPAGLAAILPTIIASVGLTGWSTTWLAIFAATAVFTIGGSLYALGNMIANYQRTPPVLSNTPIELTPHVMIPIEMIPNSSAASGLTAAPSTVPEKLLQPEATYSMFQASATIFSEAPIASCTVKDADNSKAIEDEKRSLLTLEK